MNDKQKIQAILNLLTDKNIKKLGEDATEEERYGALVFAGATFKEANIIANE